MVVSSGVPNKWVKRANESIIAALRCLSLFPVSFIYFFPCVVTPIAGPFDHPTVVTFADPDEAAVHRGVTA